MAASIPSPHATAGREPTPRMPPDVSAAAEALRCARGYAEPMPMPELRAVSPVDVAEAAALLGDVRANLGAALSDDIVLQLAAQILDEPRAQRTPIPIPTDTIIAEELL